MLMKKVAYLKFLLATLILLAGLSRNLNAQVIVDTKNVTTDKDIQYIQFLYYLEKGSFKPVYLIDFGMVETQQGTPKKQKVSIDRTEVKDSMSPIFVLNLLHKSGWEYMGDEMYVQFPMMEGWYSYTLKRKK
jgi:hypothetical protein